MIFKVVAIGHSKLLTASGCKKSLSGPKRQQDTFNWHIAPAKV